MNNVIDLKAARAATRSINELTVDEMTPVQRLTYSLNLCLDAPDEDRALEVVQMTSYFMQGLDDEQIREAFRAADTTPPKARVPQKTKLQMAIYLMLIVPDEELKSTGACFQKLASFFSAGLTSRQIESAKRLAIKRAGFEQPKKKSGLRESIKDTHAPVASWGQFIARTEGAESLFSDHCSYTNIHTEVWKDEVGHFAVIAIPFIKMALFKNFESETQAKSALKLGEQLNQSRGTQNYVSVRNDYRNFIDDHCGFSERADMRRAYDEANS